MRELHRRVRNAMAFGTTTAAVSAPGNVAQVQARLTALEVSVLKIVEQRGFASNLPVGTAVVALFQGGDRSNGVIVGSAAPGSRPALAGPEDAAMYGYGFTITIAEDGIHITAPDLFLTGNLHVNGEVFAKSEAGSVSLSQHRHANGPAPTADT